MRHGVFFLFLVVFVFISTEAVRAESPRVFGDDLAVDISLRRTSKDELRKIAELGFSNVRMGISWPEVEKQRGAYAWDLVQYRDRMSDGFDETRGFDYDDMIAFLHELGFHMSVTLFYGNTLYTGRLVTVHRGDERFTIPAAPRTPEAINAFAAFAAATVKHYSDLYGPSSFTWLIWNEPETDAGFPPKTDGSVVGQFIATTCKQIKQAVPQAKVMAPAVSVEDGGAFRYDFMRALFSTVNPLTCLDAFTVHPYRPMAPETVVSDYGKLADFLKPWQPAAHVPLAVDEWGYPLNLSINPRHKETWRDYTQEEQAALFLRMYLVNFAVGLPLTVLYEWRDSGPDPDDDENTYGMNSFDGKEKPAVTLWRHVIPLLKGRKYLDMPRPVSCNSKVHVLLFGARFKKEHDALVAWTEMASSDVRLTGSFGGAEDVFGNKVPGKSLALSGIPFIVEIDRKNISTLTCRS
jgi:hypothetical protein